MHMYFHVHVYMNIHIHCTCNYTHMYTDLNTRIMVTGKHVCSLTCLGMQPGSWGTKMTGRRRRFLGMGTDIDMKGSKVTDSCKADQMYKIDSQIIASFQSSCTCGCAVLLCLVCLFDLACFSLSSLIKKMYMYIVYNRDISPPNTIDWMLGCYSTQLDTPLD